MNILCVMINVSVIVNLTNFALLRFVALQIKSAEQRFDENGLPTWHERQQRQRHGRQ